MSNFDTENRCVECGENLGEYNPRQFCRKSYCDKPNDNYCSDEEFAHEYRNKQEEYNPKKRRRKDTNFRFVSLINKYIIFTNSK